MCKIFLIFLFALWNPEISTSAEARSHPFHLSVAEMRYNPATNSIEVALKLFTDDLESALTSSYGNQGWQLAEKNQLPEIDKYLRKYLKTRFVIRQKNEILPIKWVGAEYNLDAVWCYFEVGEINAALPLKWTNIVFFEIFRDQKNVGHFYAGEEVTSVYTTPGATSKKLMIE